MPQKSVVFHVFMAKVSCERDVVAQKGRHYRQIQMHDDAIPAPSERASERHSWDGRDGGRAGENRSNVKYPPELRPRLLTMGGR